MIEFVVWRITEMGGAEALEKAWMAGMGGWRGETTYSDGGLYGDGDDVKNF